MARTAPAPNIPPIPGMCPSILVAAGGSDSGGSGGQGAGSGGGGGPGSGAGAADGTGGDGTAAPDPKKYPLCGTKSHPVDVVTGRAFTHPIVDFETGGPSPFVFQRSASSSVFGRDFGLGPSWGHTLGWQLEFRRDAIWVFTENGTKVAFPLVEQGNVVTGPFGWHLRRDHLGYELDADDGFLRRFGIETETTAKLVEIRDRNRNRTTLAYDRRGALERVTDSAGREIRVECDDKGHLLAFAVQRSPGEWIKLAEYNYDERSRLIGVVDADGHRHVYAYNDRNQMTLDQNRAGLRFHFRFDEQSRCIESWGDYGDHPDPSLAEGVPAFLHDGVTRCKGIHHCVFEWGDDGFCLVTDSKQSSSFFGNRFGLIDKMVEGGASTTATYRADGHLLSLTDAEGATVGWERDLRGRILRVTDRLGRISTIERDAWGLPTRIVDPENGETLFTRDSRGNALTIRDAAGGITDFEYDARGLITKTRQPTGGVTTATYDSMGNRSSMTQPDGGVWTYGYDFLGRRTTTRDPLGDTVVDTHSTRGDLLSSRDALGNTTSYQYDGERQLILLQSPSGRPTRLTWGGYQRVCVRTEADGSSVRLGYSVEGELTHVWNEKGETHRLVYNAAGQLTDEHTFDGRHLSYKHDKLGRPNAITTANRRTTLYEYDSEGQLKTRTYFDETVDTFEYNLRGELIRATSADGIETRFERDALGRIVKDVQTLRAERHDVSVSLDFAGERVERRTSLGFVEEIERDRSGRRRTTKLDGRSVTHVSNFLGWDLARSLPGGGAIENAFDQTGRLVERRSVTAFVNPPGISGQPDWVGAESRGMTAQKRFAYDLDGDLTDSADRDTGLTTYRYDPLGKLLARIPDKAKPEFFRYDDGGNVHPAGENSTEREYGPGNRLNRDGNTEIIWDADGRVKEKRRLPSTSTEAIHSWKYQWNGAGLLARAESSEGLSVEFLYDAFARRLEKRVSRKKDGSLVPVRRVRFIWDGDVLVHDVKYEREGHADPVVEERTYWFDEGGFEPLAHRERRVDPQSSASEVGQWVHYLNDPLGTPERLVDETGRVVATFERKAWGHLETIGTSGASTPLRLQGQYWDEETELAYNRYRYCDSALFLSSDPLGLLGGLNQFQSPEGLNQVDPLGLARGRKGTHINNGNANEGWQHIEERHITGVQPGGDLFPPGTTRAQCTAAAVKVVEKGVRLSDPQRRIQTFEKRMKVNGRSDRVRVVVDSEDNNRVITMFPARTD